MPPAAYLAWYVAGDLGVYVALDPSSPTAFTVNTLVLLALALGAAYTLHVLGRRRLPEGVVPAEWRGQAGQSGG